MEKLSVIIQFLEGLLKEIKNPNSSSAILELSLTTALDRLKWHEQFNSLAEAQIDPKISEEIKGVEISYNFYQEFIKRYVRVNEGMPNDEIIIYYNDGYMRTHKII